MTFIQLYSPFHHHSFPILLWQIPVRLLPFLDSSVRQRQLGIQRDCCVCRSELQSKINIRRTINHPSVCALTLLNMISVRRFERQMRYVYIGWWWPSQRPSVLFFGEDCLHCAEFNFLWKQSEVHCVPTLACFANNTPVKVDIPISSQFKWLRIT